MLSMPHPPRRSDVIYGAPYMTGHRSLLSCASSNQWHGASQARKDEGNLKFEVSETDGHVFRVDERWTSKRTMFKCDKLAPLVENMPKLSQDCLLDTRIHAGVVEVHVPVQSRLCLIIKDTAFICLLCLAL